jgi:hypothetical protein
VTLVFALALAGQPSAAVDASGVGAPTDACTTIGTPGPDVLVGTAGDDVLCGRGGDDVLRGGDGKDRLLGGGGNDRLYGGDDNDRLRGGPGDDGLFGEGGSDNLRGGLGADELHGGEGRDLGDYLAADAGVSLSAGDGAGDGVEDEGDEISADVENLRGGSGNDALRGTAGPNWLHGFNGDDRLDGAMGDDRVYGGRGSDTLDGRDAASFTDTLVCGVGDADAARADTPDQVNGDCENVDQNHAPSDLSLSKASVAENQPAATVVGTISATDPDAGNTQTYSLASGTGDGDNGSFAVVGSELRTSAVFDYEAKQSYSLRIRATDGEGGTFEKQFTITVTDVNEPPTAVNDSAAVGEDAGASAIDVLANDIDTDGGPKAIASASDPANGTVLLTGGSPGAHTGLTYEPDPNYCNDPPGTSPDTFTYTVNGGSTATVSVTVTCDDDAPTAVNDTATVPEDSSATPFDVLANDTDPDGGPKAIASASDPANGTVALTGGLPGAHTGLTYEPDPNYCNDPPGTTPDTFTYTLNGGSTATVSVTVTCGDDAPTAVDDTATVGEDSGASAIDVLANDTDPDGGPMSITATTDGAHGTVAITGGGSGLTYAPAANFCGSDSFTYTLNGGSSATVSVTVTCVDDLPVAVDDSATVTEDGPATAIDVLANDTDPDGGPITIMAKTDGAHGTVTITGGGTGLTYQPAANFCGSDSFTYTLNGGSTATVSVTVTCVDDPPTAVNDSATMLEDAAATAVDVLANDTDIDGGPIAITAKTDGAHGTVVITGGGAGLTYQPAANFCGSDSFTYTLTPGGSTATVSVTVTCVDDPPTAVNDSATVLEDAAATAIDVLANDTDIDGGPKAIGSVTQPTNGTVVVTGGGTGLTYKPGLNYCNDPPGTSPDTFTYALTPGGSTATVSVKVTCVNDPPANVVNRSHAVTGNVRIQVAAPSLLAGVTDVEGDSFSATAVASGTTANGGNYTISAAGGYAYNPPPGYEGSDSFSYQVCDTGSPVACASANVDLTISGMLWFLDNSASAAGNGRLTSPFNSLAGFNAVNDGVGNHPAAGEVIFIDRLTATDYTGPLTLQNTQKVLGKGASVSIATFAGITLAADSDPLPTTGGTKPKITTTTGTVNGINLASGNTLRGLEVGNTTGVGIFGTSFGTLTVSETSVTGSGQALGLSTGSFASGSSFDVVSSSSGASGISLTTVGGDVTIPAGTLTGSTGTELAINGGAGSFSYGGSITNSAARAVSIQNKTGGTVTVSGAVTDTVGTGTGVLLSSNTGATITFSGGLTLSTGANAALSATDGGSVNVTGTGNTLTTTTGTALNVANTTIGASGLNFRSVSVDGNDSVPTNGIVLNNTGSSGGLSISGTGSAGTGGTIQDTSGDAILLTTTEKLSLSYMSITSNMGDGIGGSGVNGFVLANDSITGNGNDAATDESGINLANVTGTVAAGARPTSITNTTISNNNEFELQIRNNLSTLANLQMSGNTISSNGQPINGNATSPHGNLVNFLGGGTSVMTLTVTSGTFTGNWNPASPPATITATAISAVNQGTAHTVNVSGATFSNNNVGVDVSSDPIATDLRFNISNNSFQFSRAVAINSFQNGNPPYNRNVNGTIQNNTIGTLGSAGSGSALGNGISVQNEGAITVNFLISGNTVQEVTSFPGISTNVGLAGLATGGGTTNVTITNNVVRNIGSRAIVVQDNQSLAPFPTVCADISGNSFSGIAGQAGNGEFMRVRRLNGTVNVRQKTPTAAADATELDDANGFNDPTKINVSGTVNFNAGACTQPS